MRSELPVVLMVFILAHGICFLWAKKEHEQELRHTSTPSHQHDVERQLHKGTNALSERHDKINLKTFSKTKTHAQTSNILNDVINFQANVRSHDTDENTREDPSVVADSTSINEIGGANKVGQQQSKIGTKMPSNPEAGHTVGKLEAEKLEGRNYHGLVDWDLHAEESKQLKTPSMQSWTKTDNYNTVKPDHDNISIYQRSTNLSSLEAPVKDGQQITESPVTENKYLSDMTTSQITEPYPYDKDDTDLTDDAYAVQNVPYDYPTDHYVCGSCKCHYIDSGSKSNIYADCSHTHFNSTALKKIYSNIVTLDMSQTHFDLNTFEGFAVYPSLTTLILKINEINNLRNVSCVLEEMLQITTLNINHNRISNIDDNSFACLLYLVNLDLSHNLLKKILTRTLWGVPQLTYLNLGNNKIIHIEEGAFDIHNKLTYLHLKTNSLLSYDSLSPRLFRFLTSVTTLSIADLKPNETSYPNAALGQLKSLQVLDINGMNDVQLGPDLRSLANLYNLKVFCRPLAETRNISANYLQYTPYLTTLQIVKCQLIELSPEVYKSVPLLKTLSFDIVHFPFDQFFDHLVGLKNSEVTHLGATSLVSDDPNPCRCLSKRHSKHIQHMTKLEVLSLVDNRITFIGADFVAGLPPSIRKIDLAKNFLVQYRSIVPLCANLPNLVSLIENRQNRITYWRGKKGGYQTETCGSSSLVLPTNHLTNVDQNYLNRASDLREVKESNIYNNEQIFSRKNVFLNITSYSAAESFQFGDYFLHNELDKVYRTRILNISNVFNGGLGIRKISQWVEIVDLSNNSCDSLSDELFHINNSLVELHMCNNFLGYELFKDVAGIKFSRLSSVQFIDISTNYLQVLPYLVFKGLYMARIINLSNNNIRNVDIYLAHMKNLMFIDLSRNDVNWISRETRNDLDTLALKHKVSIDLTSNPLPCSCTGIELLQWLLTTNVQILNRDFLECVNEQKNTELIGNLKLRVASLKRSCVSTTFIIPATSAAIVVILVITAAVVLFRNRWKLHYLKNIVITKYFGFKVRGTDDPNYTFDAYFLYSEEDRRFVLREVLQELEQKRGHRLCVEDRDFIPGTFAPCNITSAVSSSRVTIPVISPDFWEDDWSEYGLQMAVMESIHAKRNVLHLLLYKHVPVEDMSRDLIKVHKDNRFSEYPPENCGDDVKEAFWDALSQAIGHTNNPDGQLVLEH